MCKIPSQFCLICGFSQTGSSVVGRRSVRASCARLNPRVCGSWGAVEGSMVDGVLVGSLLVVFVLCSLDPERGWLRLR